MVCPSFRYHTEKSENDIGLGYLHFSYYGVVIAILRRLIRSTALPPRCNDDQLLASIRQVALQTAQNAISFALSLRPDQLEAFWYFSMDHPTAQFSECFGLYSNSFSLSLRTGRIFYDSAAGQLPLFPGAELLAGDTQLLPVEPANDEQEQ